MSRFSGAVIGCGRMGAFTGETMRQYAPACWLPLSHSEAMASQPDISLLALCDVDANQLAQAQARYGVTSGYRDYRVLIDEIGPDVLGIATRTPERPGVVEYALSKGVRALHLEKPLCNGVAQLEKLEQLIAPHTVICTYGTLRRYLPIYGRARDLARSGRYGTLEQIQVCFGSAPLLWCHPHSLDILLFMAEDADVRSVSARFSDAGFDVDGNTIDGDPVVLSALVEFSSGVTGLIGQGGGWDVVLSCTEGTITVESDGRRIRFRCRAGDDPYWHDCLPDGHRDVESWEQPGGTRLALDRLVSGLRGENPAQIAADKRAILVGQRLIFACAQSHLLGGAAVDPHRLDDDLTITGRNGGRYA